MFAMLSIPLWAAPKVLALDSTPVIRENFENLNDWKPLRFDKTKKDTVYSAGVDDGVTCLKAESESSASAILCNKEFDVYQYPVVKWKWKVSNVYKKGDIRKKESSDSPARLYVMFKYDPEKAGFFTRIKYSLAKKIYGQYPPDSALCYVWESRSHKDRIIQSPSYGQIKYIVLEAGDEQVGKWRDEEVDILKDYKKAFGKLPPRIAGISFMNNSDNTEESSTSWLTSLEVLQSPASYAADR